jgi:tetrapyrrole methylase family protein / MazG family protein
MHGITIIGLGPGSPEQITLEAWRALEGASEVYLRTLHHPVVEALPHGPTYRSFDPLYEGSDSFSELYETMAQQIVALAERPEGVIYAVPGHPTMGETTVRRALELAAERGVPSRLIAGLSFLEPTITALGIDPFDGLQISDATLLALRHHPSLDPDVAALVVQVYNRQLASEVKLTLMSLYHDDHAIRLVRAAGTPAETVRDLPLHALDRQEDLDHLSSVYLPPLDKPGSVSRFQDVVARLRAPDGCPWDREQTHQTLRTHLLEETYEVLDALDADDMDKLREELGDLMLQILMHAQIATEDGDFNLIDAMQHTIEKLIRRHPHVFGGETVQDADEVLRHWEQIKRQERGEQFASLLSGISRALPSLSQALEMQRRAARVGFDWGSVEPVEAKVAEEIEEFRLAPDPERRSAEFGDLLFSLVNLARWHAIDPESALRQANQRFARRFEVIERHAAEAGRPLEEMTLEEMDRLWNEAKAAEADGQGSA